MTQAAVTDIGKEPTTFHGDRALCNRRSAFKRQPIGCPASPRPSAPMKTPANAPILGPHPVDSMALKETGQRRGKRPAPGTREVYSLMHHASSYSARARVVSLARTCLHPDRAGQPRAP